MAKLTIGLFESWPPLSGSATRRSGWCCAGYKRESNDTHRALRTESNGREAEAQESSAGKYHENSGLPLTAVAPWADREHLQAIRDIALLTKQASHYIRVGLGGAGDAPENYWTTMTQPIQSIHATNRTY